MLMEQCTATEAFQELHLLCVHRACPHAEHNCTDCEVSETELAFDSHDCTSLRVCMGVGVHVRRYASFLAVLILNAMIYNQFSYERAPGATGKTAYYIARISEYALGMLVAFVFTILDPWWVFLC